MKGGFRYNPCSPVRCLSSGSGQACVGVAAPARAASVIQVLGVFLPSLQAFVSCRTVVRFYTISSDLANVNFSLCVFSVLSPENWQEVVAYTLNILCYHFLPFFR